MNIIFNVIAWWIFFKFDSAMKSSLYKHVSCDYNKIWLATCNYSFCILYMPLQLIITFCT